MKQTFYERIGESIHRETLPNGLQICIVPKPDFVKKYAFFATRYGGMDTRFQLGGVWRDTPAGIAHYLEHKMFDTQEGNALQKLAQNGAEPNAFTSNSMTGYYFDSTSHFEENLEILLSFVSIPYFTEESVAKEQGIISQEIRMIEDNTPSNMILTVVGNVDPIHVVDLARRILPREGGPAIPRDYGDEPSAIAERETKLTMEVSMPQFLLGFKCRPVDGGEDYLRTSLLGDMACDLLLGESSPLYQRLYTQGLIDSSFGGDYEVMPGVAHLFAGGDSKDPHAVAGEIQKEVERIAAQGFDPAFYEQVRRALYGAYLRALNSFENIAVSLTEGYFRGYDPFRFPQIFESVSQNDVLDFLRENVSADRAVLSQIVPKD